MTASSSFEALFGVGGGREGGRRRTPRLLFSIASCVFCCPFLLSFLRSLKGCDVQIREKWAVPRDQIGRYARTDRGLRAALPAPASMPLLCTHCQGVEVPPSHECRVGNRCWNMKLHFKKMYSFASVAYVQTSHLKRFCSTIHIYTAKQWQQIEIGVSSQSLGPLPNVPFHAKQSALGDI